MVSSGSVGLGTWRCGSISYTMGLELNWITGLFQVGPKTSNASVCFNQLWPQRRTQFTQFMPELRRFTKSGYESALRVSRCQSVWTACDGGQGLQLVDPLGA